MQKVCSYTLRFIEGLKKMEGVVRLPQSGRIRSFFIKDILEHKRSPAEPPMSPPKGSVVVDQGTHTVSSPRPYSVQHILETNGQRAEAANACNSGCCECSSVYTYKTVTTPFYHPYLYSLYRQQAAWRHSLKDGVAYVDPQNAMYSQSRQRKPRRPWTRAVFSNLQRKGLEKRFQVQKYLTKGDRHQLASMLGLSDNQVKVWFQNRRMKWRQEEQAQSKEEPASEKKKDTQATVVSSNDDTARKE